MKEDFIGNSSWLGVYNHGPVGEEIPSLSKEKIGNYLIKLAYSVLFGILSACALATIAF